MIHIYEVYWFLLLLLFCSNGRKEATYRALVWAHGVRLYSLSGQGTRGSWRMRLLLTSGLMGKQKGDSKWVQDKDLRAHPQQLTS